jgi:hypothetical protein
MNCAVFWDMGGAYPGTSAINDSARQPVRALTPGGVTGS